MHTTNQEIQMMSTELAMSAWDRHETEKYPNLTNSSSKNNSGLQPAQPPPSVEPAGLLAPVQSIAWKDFKNCLSAAKQHLQPGTAAASSIFRSRVHDGERSIFQTGVRLVCIHGRRKRGRLKKRRIDRRRSQGRLRLDGPDLSRPLPSARQHPSYGDCLEVKREYYQNCSVLDCVTQCLQSAARLREQFLQVQQIEFVTLGP